MLHQLPLAASRRRRHFFVAALLALSLASGSVQAATVTWSGDGTDDNLLDPANWVSNPTVSDGDALVFAGDVRTSPFLNQAFTAQTVTFDATAAAFSLGASGGGVLTIDSASTATANVIVNTSTALQTFNVDVKLQNSSSAIFQIYLANGDLEFGAGHTVTFNTLTSFLINPGKTATFKGIATGSENLQLKSGGTLAFTNSANTWAGTGNKALEVTDGTVLLGGALGTASSGYMMSSGGGSNRTAKILIDADGLTVASGQTIRGMNDTTSEVVLGSSSNMDGAAAFSGDIAIGFSTITTQLRELTVSAGHADGKVTFSGVISHGGSGGTSLSNVTKKGAGTVILSGSASNSYTGVTTVTQGTLALAKNPGFTAISGTALKIEEGAAVRLDQSDQIVDTAGLDLSGMFDLNGTRSEKVGLLSYDDGTLDFGAAGSSQAFLISGEGAFSGTLTIANWTDGSDIFAVASGTVLSSGFLGGIVFEGYGTGAMIGATNQTIDGYDGTYDFIVAASIPEASVGSCLLLGLGAFCTVAFAWGRRRA
ncbi:MAG TPA: autotransporter-associated beta strand repeat-containing protein [Chthoniobacteraceae bacterium]|nr:autotransporter-associated beta strand repeat-containing protein [Chthoniobacteraceae bacterium]